MEKFSGIVIAVSILSENHAALYREVVGYLSGRLGVRIEFNEAACWQDREQMLYRGDAQMGFLCGLPYVRQARAADPPLEILAAPVMRGARYANKPVYFSDVVVAADSPYRAFRDLAGKRWAYNGADSHSGYNLVAAFLVRAGLSAEFFGEMRESGAHLTSLQWVIEGVVDASAIDTTVLESELAARPELARQIRIVSTLGPSPICPVVVSRNLDASLKRRLREELVGMDRDPEGARVLDRFPVRRFASVEDSDYDPIRQMEAEAASVTP